MSMVFPHEVGKGVNSELKSSIDVKLTETEAYQEWFVQPLQMLRKSSSIVLGVELRCIQENGDARLKKGEMGGDYSDPRSRACCPCVGPLKDKTEQNSVGTGP